MTAELQAAIRRGVLTDDQLVELITYRAEQLGLSFDEARAAWADGTLPKNARGDDLALLIGLMEAPAAV